MNTKITNISDEIAREYGAIGTPKRAKFDEEAMEFYTAQIIAQARKEVKMSQVELAKKLNVNKSYISRIENGITVPSADAFYRIINALGLSVEITLAIK